MNFEEFKKHDGYNALLVGGALLAICPFLPWLSAMGTSKSGMDLQGEMILFCGLGGYIAFLSWNAMTQNKIPDLMHLKVSVGASILLFLYYYNEIDEAKTAANALSRGKVSVNNGFGMFVAIAGCGALGFGLYKLINSGTGTVSSTAETDVHPVPTPPAAAPPAAPPPAATPPAPAPPAAAPPAPPAAESDEPAEE